MSGFVITIWNLAQMICGILTMAQAVIDAVLVVAEEKGKIESEDLDLVRGWLAQATQVCLILEKVVF